MTSTTGVDPAAALVEPPRRGLGAAVLDLFRDPVRTFVVLALSKLLLFRLKRNEGRRA